MTGMSCDLWGALGIYIRDFEVESLAGKFRPFFDISSFICQVLNRLSSFHFLRMGFFLHSLDDIADRDGRFFWIFSGIFD